MDDSDGDIIYPPETNVAIVGGEILPIGPRQINAGEILEQLKSVISRPYTGPDPEKQGMSLIDAALFSAARQAADGDIDALDKILNRIMGKPLQSVSTVGMTVTLKEYLEQIAPLFLLQGSYRNLPLVFV